MLFKLPLASASGEGVNKQLALAEFNQKNRFRIALAKAMRNY